MAIDIFANDYWGNCFEEPKNEFNFPKLEYMGHKLDIMLARTKRKGMETKLKRRMVDANIDSFKDNVCDIENIIKRMDETYKNYKSSGEYSYDSQMKFTDDIKEMLLLCDEED